MNTTLFVVNPISGGKDKKSLLSTIRSWAESSNTDIRIWETSGKNDKENLKKEVDEWQPEKVVAVGGDGTLLLCAEVLMHTDIPLGIIPGGSANGMAAELEIPQNTEDALAVIANGKQQYTDLLCFNEKDYCLHISDIGINARLVKYFEESGRRGFLGYAEGLISELVNLDSFNVHIKTENTEIKEQCYMVAFANAKRYGTGALLNNLGKIDDGFLEICILKKFDLAGIAGQFMDMIDANSGHMDIIQCKEAVVKVDKAVCFQADGELKGNISMLKVSIVPRCLHLIVPDTTEF